MRTVKPSPSASPPPLPKGEAFRKHHYNANWQRKQVLCRNFVLITSPLRVSRQSVGAFYFRLPSPYSFLYSRGDISQAFLNAEAKPESDPKPDIKQASDTEKPFASIVRA